MTSRRNTPAMSETLSGLEQRMMPHLRDDQALIARRMDEIARMLATGTPRR